jgi:hypothetical protein
MVGSLSMSTRSSSSTRRWRPVVLLCLCVCVFVLLSLHSSSVEAINRFPLKNKAKNKQPPKEKPRPPRINEAILPSLQQFLEEVQLSDYFNDFVRMGFVDTKHCLRLADMDFRIMQYEWNDMNDEKINRLKKSVSGKRII